MSDKSADAGNPSNFGSSVMTAKSSAQEDFYRYKLLEARLGENNPILKSKSEKDHIMEAILGKIVNVRESTAEWSELVSLTGTENRFAQAEKLADIAWEKRRAELVLAKYAGSSDELASVYSASEQKVAEFRAGRSAVGTGGGLGGGATPRASVLAQVASRGTGGALASGAEEA